MPSIDTVYLFANDNLYGSKRYFTHHLAAALRRHGITAVVVDAAREKASSNFIEELLRAKPTFTCSFNLMLPLEEGGSRYFCDELQIPHLSILVDAPIGALELTESPWSLLSCVDRNDCEMLHQYGFHKCFFLPHAVEAELANKPLDEGDRIYDIAFTGSCYDYESLRDFWRQDLSPLYRDVLEEAITTVLSSDYTPLLEALMSAWRHQTSGLSATGGAMDFRGLYLLLDYYTRGWDRTQLIRNMAKKHPVHVFGARFGGHASSSKGWDYYLADYPNAIVHPPVDFSATMAIMRQSKICLNSMPFFRDGSHERFLAALVCGSVPITSDSLWIREEFVEGQELLIYSSDERETVVDRVTGLLANNTLRRDIAAAGRRKVLSYHTWDQRVETLMEAVPSFLTC